MQDEQLGRQRADQPHGDREPATRALGTTGDVLIDRGRRHGLREDAGVVDVAGDRERRRDAVDAARDDDRALVGEVELAFGQQRRPRRAAEPLDRAVDLGGRGDADLPAAVVAAGGRLEPQRQAEPIGCGTELIRGADLAPRRDGDAGAFDEPPLGEAVLGHDQRVAAGPDRPGRVDRADDVGGDVFELVGHDRAPFRQPLGGTDIVIRGEDQLVGDDGSRTVRVRVEDRDPIAHGPGRDGQHPAELAAAQDADRGRRIDRRRVVAQIREHGRDPGLLAERVLERAVDVVGDDLGLERGVLRQAFGIGAQGIPEGQVALQLGRPGLDVAVDAQRDPVLVDRADEHGPRRRPRVRTGLRLEPQAVEHLDDGRDVGRVGRDRRDRRCLCRASPGRPCSRCARPRGPVAGR